MISLHRDKTAQHSTAQHSTAQHSTAQHSTAQHSTAQHSTTAKAIATATAIAGSKFTHVQLLRVARSLSEFAILFIVNAA